MELPEHERVLILDTVTTSRGLAYCAMAWVPNIIYLLRPCYSPFSFSLSQFSVNMFTVIAMNTFRITPLR